MSGLDVMSHSYKEAEPKTPPPKGRKAKIAKTLVEVGEEDKDPNVNSFASDKEELDPAG